MFKKIFKKFNSVTNTCAWKRTSSSKAECCWVDTLILDFGDTKQRIQQWTVSTSDLHSPEKCTWELLSIIKCVEVCYSAKKNY